LFNSFLLLHQLNKPPVPKLPESPTVQFPLWFPGWQWSLQRFTDEFSYHLVLSTGLL